MYPAHITILCDHFLPHKPRSTRLLSALDSMGFFISVIHKGMPKSFTHKYSERVSFYCFPMDKSSKERSAEENAFIVRACEKGEFEKLIYTPNRAIIPHLLDSIHTHDLLILEDITLLPFACKYVEKLRERGKQCKILIDLREYYPLEYESDPLWMSRMGKFFYYLCETYLPAIDYAMSVSEGLCTRYKDEFGIACEIYYSLPPYFDISPSALRSSDIRLLYHGFISPDRSSMELLEFAQVLETSPFSLSVMALSNQKGFLERFVQESCMIKSLHILEPVNLENIIPVSADFDIGLIPFKPTSFNLMHCMPNKFFEYIQARLMVLATPLESVSHFVDSQKVGLCANGFEVKDMLNLLASLTPSMIEAYKANAHKAAHKWHLEYNIRSLKKLLRDKLDIKVE